MKRNLKIVSYIVRNLKKVSIFETKGFDTAPCFFSVARLADQARVMKYIMKIAKRYIRNDL
jgi:hypothetical protein